MYLIFEMFKRAKIKFCVVFMNRNGCERARERDNLHGGTTVSAQLDGEWPHCFVLRHRILLLRHSGHLPWRLVSNVQLFSDGKRES